MTGISENKRKLDSLLKKTVISDARRQVVYGLYDNSSSGISTRIDDFMIDHSRVPLQEKAYFFHLLAVMIDAGIPVMNAIKRIEKRLIVNSVFHLFFCNSVIVKGSEQLYRKTVQQTCGHINRYG